MLIEGETGTGKGTRVIAARHPLHASALRTGPLVAVAFRALPENLLESELFGHEKGSFTSAVSQRRGRFEMADGGTLFLDEVGDVPAPMQAKLRVAQERPARTSATPRALKWTCASSRLLTARSSGSSRKASSALMICTIGWTW